jgi:hypothetical protein
MSSGPKQHLIRSLAVSVCRALLATLVAVSFFATTVSVGAASSGAAGMMACCIGKTGHDSGSCSSGLLVPVKKPQPEPEVLCGQETGAPETLSTPPAPAKAASSKISDAGVEVADGGHCNLHSPSTRDVTSASPRQSHPEATSVKYETAERRVMHALSNPCSTDCGACSVSYARPRPREHSNLSSLARPRLHLTSPLPPSEYPQIKPLKTNLVQLRPRAPPAHCS